LGLVVSLGSAFRARCATGPCNSYLGLAVTRVSVLSRPQRCISMGAACLGVSEAIKFQRRGALGSNWDHCVAAAPARSRLAEASFLVPPSHPSGGGCRLDLRPRIALAQIHRRKTGNLANSAAPRGVAGQLPYCDRTYASAVAPPWSPTGPLRASGTRPGAWRRAGRQRPGRGLASQSTSQAEPVSTPADRKVKKKPT
jgi:hypothetical protein